MYGPKNDSPVRAHAGIPLVKCVTASVLLRQSAKNCGAIGAVPSRSPDARKAAFQTNEALSPRF